MLYEVITKDRRVHPAQLVGVLGLPIPEIRQEKAGASAVVLSGIETINPVYTGWDVVCQNPRADFRLFGKEAAREYRRMGVVVLNAEVGTDVLELQKQARELADQVVVKMSYNFV